MATPMDQRPPSRMCVCLPVTTSQTRASSPSWPATTDLPSAEKAMLRMGALEPASSRCSAVCWARGGGEAGRKAGKADGKEGGRGGRRGGEGRRGEEEGRQGGQEGARHECLRRRERAGALSVTDGPGPGTCNEKDDFGAVSPLRL